MNKRVENLVWWALDEKDLPCPPATLQDILEAEQIIKELGGEPQTK